VIVTAKSNLPEELCKPPGFLGEYVSYLEEITEYVCLEFSLLVLCVSSL